MVPHAHDVEDDETLLVFGRVTSGAWWRLQYLLGLRNRRFVNDGGNGWRRLLRSAMLTCKEVSHDQRRTVR